MQRAIKTLIHIVVVIVGIGLIFLLERGLSRSWRESHKHEQMRVATQLKSSIRLAMERKISAMMSIAGWYQHSEQLSEEKLEKFVAVATRGNPSFVFVMYADAKLIIRGCSPPQPDLNIVGFDLKDDDYTYSLAREAETKKAVILSGPQPLPGGGKCFFVLAPIFLDKDLGGIVIGVFEQASALEEIVPPELTEAFYVWIRDAAGSQIFGKPGEGPSQERYERITFHNSKSDWFLAVEPKEKLSREFIYYRLPVWLLGLMLLAVVTAFIHAIYHRREELEQLVAERTEELQTAYNKLEQVAITDPLTGLFNRRFFYQRFGEELSRAKRSKMPLSCLILDLDNFKLVNDRHGHLLGDQILVETAKILRRNTRKEDVAARYGGEEFVLLLVGTNKEQAMAAATRIRKDIENAWFDRFANDPKPFRLTASVGITEFQPDSDTGATDNIIQQADTALYKAKSLGKNKVVVFSPEDENSYVSTAQKPPPEKAH